LLIEDEAFCDRFLARGARRHGYAVGTPHLAAEGLKMLTAGKYSG